MYTKPELIVEVFDVEDVLTTSSGTVDPPATDDRQNQYDPNETPFMPLG